MRTATTTPSWPDPGRPMTRARAQRETSAGGVVYRVDAGTPLFLLIRDSYANWGFPKGHLEVGERAEDAALREVREETGLHELALRGTIDTIDWYFRFRGRLIHKVCHFYLMETTQSETAPQKAEGITACRWVAFGEATEAISYGNARQVLHRAFEMISGVRFTAHPPSPGAAASQLDLAFDEQADGATEKG
jgi:8-oxo-dGTP pyrophosphatase MutT (NUDIX family)